MLTTPVIGWAARRRYARFCAAPWVPVAEVPTPQPIRSTPSSRARTPQLSQARTRHNPLASDRLQFGNTCLSKATEFALLWQCSMCTGWTRDPTSKRGYVHHCTICRMTRPPRVVIFNEPDVAYFQQHAAMAYSCAAQARVHRRSVLMAAGPTHHERGTGSPYEFFVALAEERDRQLAPASSTPEEARSERWLIQLYHGGQRYIGHGSDDHSPVRTFPAQAEVFDTLPSLDAATALCGSEFPEARLSLEAWRAPAPKGSRTCATTKRT